MWMIAPLRSSVSPPSLVSDAGPAMLTVVICLGILMSIERKASRGHE
jgi:hypothetical protein